MIDNELRVEPVADRFLRELRFGRDRAESTSKAYANGVALFFRWCQRTGRDWRTAATDMGLFMVWLKYVPAGDGPVVTGPGAKPVRSDGRINRVLVAVRRFLSFAVVNKEAPQWVLGQIYELADSRDLPLEAQSEDGGLFYRMRARHHLREPETPVDRASDDEIVALFTACLSARDRLIVLLLARAGLRRSETAGLRRGDLHLLPNNRSMGCEVEGAHVHVIRRDNVNGAWAKSRHARTVPVDFLLVQAFDQYQIERQQCAAAVGSDFLLVNLFRAPLGSPVTPDAINDLFKALCARAGLTRSVAPHMCRHAFASNLADSGALLDEIQRLMGHASVSSSQPYLHPNASRLRAAVDRVPTPRLLIEGVIR
ncbi:tyrosine-type recombinase/integrase [Actinokineospora xionganensis]|uniref:tyrosine-type recombinase/integrase n=1 Tax=Actinokineospora xionganensis TaxID=2684470 RepID=UPI0028ABCC0E|nr:tyrosine-type recombinase/integrase [Actinokineospora xionganensis]